MRRTGLFSKLFGQQRKTEQRTASSQVTAPARKGVHVEVGQIISVTEVQRRYLEVLKRLEKVINKRFIAVDCYSEPSIKFWIIDPSNNLTFLILRELSKENLFVFVRFKDKRRYSCASAEISTKFNLEDVDTIASIDIYDRYYRNQQLIHGHRSCVTIEFPQYHPSRKEYVGWRYSFVQASIHESSVENLPRTTILGCEFLAVPNLAKLKSTGQIPEDVDLVYTWVDGSDPLWLARREAVASQQGRGLTSDSAVTSRYHNRNELFYSLRSALTYFRGIRKIFIVTDQQFPSLLFQHSELLSSGSVEIIDHKELFKNACDLPTFNSHSIEAQLHRIPNLSDKYLYLNDDFFFGRSVTPYLFFDEYGRSRYFTSRAVTIPEGPASVFDRGVDAAAKNARDLIMEHFGIYASRKFKHAPVALIKDVVYKMEKDFPEVFASTASSRFRSSSDYCVSGSLYFHYAAVTGHAVEGEIRYDYFDINASYFQEKFEKRLSQTSESERLDAFCVNDVELSKFTSRNERIFQEVLASLLGGPTSVNDADASGAGGLAYVETAADVDTGELEREIEGGPPPVSLTPT